MPRKDKMKEDYEVSEDEIKAEVLKEDIAPKNEVVEPQVQLVTSEQLVNMKLDDVLKNQEKILKNHATIFQNQHTLYNILTQEQQE